MLLPWPPRRLVSRSLVARILLIAALVTVPLLAACDTTRPIVPGFGLGGGGSGTSSVGPVTGTAGGTGGAPLGTGGAGTSDAGDAGNEDAADVDAADGG